MARETITDIARLGLSPAWMAILACGLILRVSSSVWAHEGHKPLPSKGVQFDQEHGVITLSRPAFDALAVQSSEARLQKVATKTLAYAKVVLPWGKHGFATTKVPGKIERLLVKPGEPVVAGQLLAEVRSLELDNLQLDLLTAQTELRLSEALVAQLKAGVRSGSTPERELRSAEAKLSENKNGLEIAKRKVAALGIEAKRIDRVLQEESAGFLHTLPIRAPISGLVIHSDLAVGTVVDPSVHLFEIMDTSTVWIQIEVLERDLGKISVGQSANVQLTSFPGKAFATKVSFLANSFDDKTHLGTVLAEHRNDSESDPKLLPGMSGHAELLLDDSSETLAVPTTALLTDGVDHFVLVEQAATKAGNQYQRRNVVVGQQADRYVRVLGGEVFPGDRVITAGSHELATFFIQGILRPSPEASRNIGLRVDSVGQHPIAEVVELSGRVELPPGQRATVSSTLDGTLERILIHPGQSVSAGQILAEVSSLELQSLQLDLAQATSQLEYLKGTLERIRGLDLSGVLARRQLWEVESQLNSTRNRRESTIHKLNSLGMDAEHIDKILDGSEPISTMPIRAPIDGTVTQFDKAIGQVIRREDTLLEIQDMSAPLVEAFVSERDLEKVRPGDHARIRFVADPNIVAEGTVVRSAEQFDPQNQTLSVWIEFNASSPLNLQQGMYANAVVATGESKTTIAIPREAVVQEGTRSFVFMQHDDGSFIRREVTVGRSDDRRIEIVEGLSLGDRIAVSGTAGLQTGYAALR